MKIEFNRFKDVVINSNDKEILKNNIPNISELSNEELTIVLEKFYNESNDGTINFLMDLFGSAISDDETMINKIKDFQTKKDNISLESNEFIQLLEFCNIRVPKGCYTVLNWIKGNGHLQTSKNNKKTTDSIFKAYYKLMEVTF